MEALKEFLFDHKSHALTYDAPESYDEMEKPPWEEIDANSYKTS